MPRTCAAELTFLLLTTLPSEAVLAHAKEFWGVHPLAWRSEHIDGVVVYGDSGQKIAVEGEDCLTGGSLHFDVEDQYAFDIDETVWLDLELHVESAGSKLIVSYDKSDVAPRNALSGEPEARKELELVQRSNERRQRTSIPLERARFANLGYAGSDFSIQGEFTVCKLSVRRSHATTVADRFGRIAIEVLDTNGEPTPARMGIYDHTGRLPLPSDAAVTLRDLNSASRVVSLRMHASPWPVKNRSVFYTNGQYQARLPVGEYELIVAKGPEYRFARQRFAITADQTKIMKIELRRWEDMAAKGWYSGEDHIHYARESTSDDRDLQLFAQAEDLRVANILQMGNIASTYFPHHDWKPLIDRRGSFVLVPGQEDPRTSRLGHTIELNIRQPVRNPARYFLYHEVFEKVRAQGGLVGYAHLNEVMDGLNATAGMAIDMPFGLVDFAEVLSLHLEGVSTWFDFLNLGYKVSPGAGTDYPWGDVPGAVRNYVKIDKSFAPQAWFDGLKEGRTFVTSGPMLEISINGQGMGSEIRVRRGEPLSIVAKASVNPDVDELVSLELIEHGEPVKEVSSAGGAPSLGLNHELRAQHGTWFVLRARGQRPHVVALSAPIYVLVDGQSFWKPAEVPRIVAKQKSRMQEVLGSSELERLEAWEAREPDAKQWSAQRSLLKQRIDAASALYDDLVKRAATRRNQQ